MYVTVSLGYVFQKSEMGLSKDSEILHGLPTNKNIRIPTKIWGPPLPWPINQRLNILYSVNIMVFLVPHY